MLFVSVGFAVGQNYNVTVTLPADATNDVVITVDADGTYTDTGIKANGKTITIPAKTYKGKPVTIYAVNGTSSVSIKNEVSLITVDHASLKKLEAVNVGLKKLTITKAPQLEILNVSGNKGLTISGTISTTIKDLNISNCDYVGSNHTWDLSGRTNLEKLDVSGNRLKEVKVPEKFKESTGFIKGLQDFSDKDTYTTIANTNLDINAMGGIYGLANSTLGNIISADAKGWKKISGSGDGSEAHKVENGNTLYRFYGTDKVYTDGEFECVLNREDGFQFKVRFTVTPAKFKLKLAELPDGAKMFASDKTGDITEKDVELEQGAEVSITVNDENSTRTFSKFTELVGLKPVKSTTETSNPIICEIAGAYDLQTDGFVSINALLDDKSYEVSYNAQANGGKISVKREVPNGDPEPIDPSKKYPYGTKLVVTLIPDLDFKPQLTVNDAPVTQWDSEENNQYVYTIELTENTKITAGFIKSATVQVSALINGDKITSGQLNIRQNGKNHPLNSTDVSVNLLPNVPCQLTIGLGNNMKLAEVRVNDGKPLEVTSVPQSDGSVMYHMEFTPTTKSIIYIKTQALSEIQITVTNKKQKYVYDGTAKAFEFSTTPAEYKDKVVVTYKSKADAGATESAIRAGYYEVGFGLKDEAKANYYIKNAPIDQSLEIAKAIPVISEEPTVTIDANGKYAWAGGKVENNVEGIFEVTTSPVISTTESHMVDVIFKPEEDSNYESKTIKVEVVIGDPLEKMVVNINKDYPEGIKSVTIRKNGAVNADSGDSFVKDLWLAILVTYEEGINPDDIMVSSVLGKMVFPADDYSDLANNVKGFTYQVPGGTNPETLTVKLSQTLEYEYNVTLKDVGDIVYSGNQYIWDINNIEIKADKEDGRKFVKPNATVSYKLNNQTITPAPINVGLYTVCVTIEAGNGYKSYYHEFEEALNIVQADPSKNIDWPRVSPISKGQELKFAALVGGGSPDVEGEFTWKDETIKPKNDDKCLVVFTPANNNYKTVEKALLVTVSDQQLVTIANNKSDCSVTVVDTKGNVYASGDVVVKGTVLKITAVPSADYTLASLKVNGNPFSSGGTYTVDNNSVEIDATFQIKKEDPIIDKEGQYAVIFPDMVRGAKISYTGDPIVERDKDFKFTVTTLAADVSKLVVKANGSTLTRAADGSYTIKKVQEKQNVTISFSSTPTEVKVNIPLIYHEKGQPTSGRVQIINNTSSDGKYYYNDELTLIAYPETGVEFDSWSDKNKDSVRDIVLDKAEISLQAVFKGTPVTGIEDIESAAITTGKGFIMVKNVANAKVTVVSISGRLQAQEKVSGDTRIDVPQGIYVVVLESGSDVKQVKVIVK